MQSRMIVLVAVALLCVTAWGVPDVNVPDQVRAATPRPAAARSSEDAAPTRAARIPGDVPTGYQPPPAPAPTRGEPPQIVEMEVDADGRGPVEPKPLWGPDVTVYTGNLEGPSPAGSERMIAYDQTQDGTLFSAFVAANGETANVYRSTDGGNSWAYWNGMFHTGNVLSSLELVVAEGDSSFVFFFVKTTAGNGDIYVERMTLDGSATNIISVKVDADTVANAAACRDIENPYYLYVAYETRNGQYNMYQLRSTDYGKTWSGMPGTEEIADTQTPPKPDICYGNGGNVYTVIRDLRQSSVDSVSFRLKRSTNRGDTWLASTQIGTPITPVYDPVVGARHGSSGTVWVVHTRDFAVHNGMGLGVFVYSSTDSGASWSYGGDDGIGHGDTDNNEQMPSIACIWSDGTPTVCYAVVPSESLMFTWCDGDTNWTTPEKVNDYRHTGNFPPQAGWRSFSGNWSSVLYAGSGPANLYFDAFSLVGMEEGRTAEEKRVALVARPSPAHDRAVINYSLPRAGTARVSVSDVVGREVAVIAQGTFVAGTHSAVWNCEAVPAGVYLIRIDAGTGSQTGRIVVSR
jgi:hypothetical protein